MPWHPTLINSQILSVHAALLPVGTKGKVIMLGGSEHNELQGGMDGTPALPANVDRTAIYDVDAGADAVRVSSPTTDVFCAGHAFIGDGRLLIGGGTESWGAAPAGPAGGPGGGHGHRHGNFGGHQAYWLYNYVRGDWTRAADFNFEVGAGKGGGRWYPSLITLPSGDLVAFEDIRAVEAMIGMRITFLSVTPLAAISGVGIRTRSISNFPLRSPPTGIRVSASSAVA